MIIKRIALTLAFVVGAATSQAATLGTVETVVGGATYTDTGSATVLFGDLSYIGTTIGVPSVNPTDLLASTLTGAPSDTFSLFSILTGTTALSGSLLDIDDGAGIITALYSTTGGTYAGDYGTLFRVSLSDSLFTSTTLDALSAPTFTITTSLTLEAVQDVNVIPLPAGLVLMLSGIGTLGLLRGRRQRTV